MKKRKNSVDNAQELFKIKLEQIINQMKMYDHFHNFEDKQLEDDLNSSMAIYLLNKDKGGKPPLSMY